jgi:hypothetical protein
VISGTLIAESLRLGWALESVPLLVRSVTRVGPLTGLAPDQPNVWTFIEFTADDTQAQPLADALADGLDPSGGWYCDFRTDTETVVVFPGAVIRYPRGDPDGRARAAEHARDLGLPESQIDWPE